MIFGEFECKVDAKGRFLLPSALLKQLPEEDQQEFVLSKGLDPCLLLYPRRAWESEIRRIMSLDQYNSENRAFLRRFQSGAVPISLDAAKRVLIPKRLCEAASIDKDLILFGANDKVEIWSQERYNVWLDAEAEPFEKLAEKVMTRITAPPPKPDTP